ncbi:MAG: tRNA (guanine(10)-N(2))-dimethyltransferase, partial [Aquificae bacterium]|nr:tRNA (guanine(10)-N(2))-dimethyltransferase [Aquificota bacterium]
LSGTYPKTCMRRYMSRPLRNEFKHEVGIRILIKKVIELSAQYDIAMIPIFAYSHLHYFKLFFVKERGVERVDKLVERFGYIQYCFNCMNRTAVKEIHELRETCPHCGGRFHTGGPLWLGELWDEEFTNYLYESAKEDQNVTKETKSILSLINEEAKLQTVGFYVLSKLAEKVKLPAQPPIRIAVKFFEGVRTHFVGDGFRTKLTFDEVMKKMEELKEKQEEFLRRRLEKEEGKG